MSKYYVGKCGDVEIGVFDNRPQAEAAAIQSSLDEFCTVFSVWNYDDEIIFMAIDGNSFEKVEDQ